MTSADGKPVNRIAGKLPVPSANHANGRAKNGHQAATVGRDGATLPVPLAIVSEPSSNNDHDAKGRFTKGNKAGRGNPFARRQASMRSEASAAVTAEDMRAVFRKAAEQAKAGDADARKFLAAYVIGRPTKAVNPDRVDLEEFRLLDESPTTANVIRLMLDALPPDIVVDFVRAHLPATPKRLAKKISKGELTKQVSRERRARTGK